MARDRFRKLVAGQGVAAPSLPYVHTTDVYGLTNALEDKKLTPEPCNVFVGEPLLYFFYGKPAYRANPGEDATGLDHYLPVCLLFRNDAIQKIKRVFPFDSGGFKAEAYADAIHRRMKLDDFGLDPDPATPGRVVSLFFDSVEDYLLSRPKTPGAFDPTQMEAISYEALIGQRLSNSPDNRVSGVEVQLEGELTLHGTVEAVCLPSTALDSAVTRANLKTMRVEPLPYRQTGRMRPSEYVHTIFDQCYAYYRSVGLLP